MLFPFVEGEGTEVSEAIEEDIDREETEFDVCLLEGLGELLSDLEHSLLFTTLPPPLTFFKV